MADQEKKFLDKDGLSYLWHKITDQLNTKADNLTTLFRLTTAEADIANLNTSISNIQNDLENATYDDTEIQESISNLSGDVEQLIDATNQHERTIVSIEEELDSKADIDSPHFTGTPTAPTPSADSDSGEIATTAFVRNLIDTGISAGTAQVMITITPAVTTTITLTNADSGTIFTGTSNISGVAMIDVDEFGVFNIDYQNINVFSQETVNVTKAGTIYLVQAEYEAPVTYTVKIDIGNENPSTCVTYLDDAAGMTKGAVAWDYMPIFKDIKPCVFSNGQVIYYLDKNDFNFKEDGFTPAKLDGTDGDVMIEFPKFAYKIKVKTNDPPEGMTSTGNQLQDIILFGTHRVISVTNDPEVIENDSNYHYFAFSKNEYNDRKHFYVGAFLAHLNSNDNISSTAGVSVTTSRSFNAFKNAALNRGEGYCLFSFFQLTAILCLYLIKYGSLHGQSALGNGYTGTSNTGTQNTGKTATTDGQKGMYFGGTGTQHMKFAGIEDLWGNANQWIDGAATRTTTGTEWEYAVDWDTSKTISEYRYTSTTSFSGAKSGFISDIVTNECGFLPNEYSGGSTTKYYCDECTGKRDQVCHHGGMYKNGGAAGPFSFKFDTTATETSGSITGRLMYL